ncbi:DUF3600 domain-containing protein [Bacillus salacetis]|nr:DUF3600 domain-containing protein [Bacillus salacetis]
MSDIKQEISKIAIPHRLGDRSRLGVKQAQLEKGAGVKRFTKKHLASVVLAMSLLVPTGAFAYQTFLADELYGSFETLKARISSATMEGYFLLDAKMSQAKGDLSKEDYKHFKELLSVLTESKLEYANENGNIDYSQLPPEQLEIQKKTLFDIQPYFDQLNGLVSSQEVLTSEEYDAYIDALMVYQQVLAKTGITGPGELDKIPSEMRDEFQAASEVLDYVNEKQINYE